MKNAFSGLFLLMSLTLLVLCLNQPRQVALRFELSIPEPLKQNEKIYVSGNFNDWKTDDSNWVMQSIDSCHFFRDALMPENSKMDYKYSLGCWFHVETDSTQKDLPNRNLTIYRNLQVKDSVMYWKNHDTKRSNSDTAQMNTRIDCIMATFNHLDQPGACVMVIKDGQIVFKKAYGMANLEDTIPVTTYTNFRLASVSKQFTAMSIMLLQQKGALKLEQNLLDFFPDFPEIGRKITLNHLLTHTSGLIDYEDINPNQWNHYLKDKDVLELLKTRNDTYYEPGTRYRYSNSAYALLALIAQKTSGQSYSEYLKTEIFDPVGMTHTVALEEGINQVENRAYGYKSQENGTFYLADQSMTSHVLGDGGIYSSIEDLYFWDQALRQKKLVSEEIYQQIFTPTVWIEGRYRGYGFGWEIGSYRGLPAVWHGGSTTGFRSVIFRLTDQPVTIVILMNRDGLEPLDYIYPIIDQFCFSSLP